MEDMTKNQRAFCNEYLKDMNGTRSYKAAYPNVTKDETAAVNASRLLRNAKIKKFLNKKLTEMEAITIADATEVLEYLTRVMRGEEKEGAPDGSKYPPKITDKTKAAELLGKRYALFVDKTEHSGEIGIAQRAAEIEKMLFDD